jgi:hypothetical protein
MRDNPTIRRYYEGLGFEPRGEGEAADGRFSWALYERPVG